MKLVASETPWTNAPSTDSNTAIIFKFKPDRDRALAFARTGPNPRQSRTSAGTRYRGPTQYPPSHCEYFAKKIRSVTGSNTDRKSTRLNSSHLGISYAV